MKQRRLGRTGLTVSEICLGTMTFGNQADEPTSHAILDRAYEAGVDFLDIAESYPVPPDFRYAGRSEEFVGRWMEDKPRDGLLIATKVAGPGSGWFLAPVRANHTSLDRHHITRAVEGSLRRLGTDYIDLYQTHWPDRGVPIEETLEALDGLVRSGKVRYIGCSNETSYGLTKSLWASELNGWRAIETIQNNFSLLNRRFEDELAEVCRREAVSLLPYSPARRRRAERQVPRQRPPRRRALHPVREGLAARPDHDAPLHQRGHPELDHALSRGSPRTPAWPSRPSPSPGRSPTTSSARRSSARRLRTSSPTPWPPPT
jgi:aryl-alcohol dehydrogenase-like predicted oxidoreductase